MASGVAPGPIDVDKYAVAVVAVETVLARFSWMTTLAVVIVWDHWAATRDGKLPVTPMQAVLIVPFTPDWMSVTA